MSKRRVVIMADGNGTRWNNYRNVPKHLIPVQGEALIAKTVRMLQEYSLNLQIIITSHDSRYEFVGAERYEPRNNYYEIDRFTEELIVPDMCFLYGDTLYTETAIKTIFETPPMDILFFGNRDSIIAISIKDSELFKFHKNHVKQLYKNGIIEKCAGWQVYQSFTSQNFNTQIECNKKYVYIDDESVDIDTPEDYEKVRMNETIKKSIKED